MYYAVILKNVANQTDLVAIDYCMDENFSQCVNIHANNTIQTFGAS